MKKLSVSLLSAILAFAAAQSSKATILYTDNFNSYVNGNLAGVTQNTVGQGNWAQTSTSATTPVQVLNGTAVLGTSGQDVYSPLSSIYTITDGTSLYFGLTINVSSAQATGDYFFSYDPVVSDTGLFYSRIFVKSSGAGFVLGYLETSGAGGAVNYGSTVLSFSTAYNLVLGYNAVASGTANDTASLYVNPTDSVEGNNTAYIAGDTWTTATTENHNVAEINLRQGTGSSAAGLSVDNLIIANSFSDIVAPVPEPSTLALATLGGVTCLLAFRRKR